MSEAIAPAAQGLTRQAFHGAGWSALANIGKLILSFASVAVLARLLGPSVYGLMGMATLVLAFLTNFRDLGTAAAIIQKPQVSNRLLSSLFWVNCALGIVLFAIGFWGAIPAAHFFRDPRIVNILRVISLSFCMTTIGTVPNALLARRMDFRSIAISDFSSAVIGYGVSIPCAFAGLGVWSLVFGNLANIATATGLYFFFSAWRPELEFDRQEVRSVARFSLNMAGFGVVNYFSRNADNVVVGRVLGSIPLGYYQMAYNLFLFPIQNISSVLSQVLNPSFAKIQFDNARFRSAYVRGCMLIGLITFPVMAGLGVVVKPFIYTIMGAKWAPVIPILTILVPVGLCQSIQTTAGQIYIAKGRTDWMFRWGLYGCAVLVTAFVIGVRWGTTGVAAAYAISYFIFILYPGFWLAFKLIDLSVVEFAKRLFPQIVISVAMAAICYVWMTALYLAGVTNNLFQLLTTIALGTVVYIGAMLIIRPQVVLYLQEVLATSKTPLAAVLLHLIEKPSDRPHKK
jgi:O-antigen/teichoic acid export membrane protein